MIDAYTTSGEVAPEEEARLLILNTLGLSLATKLSDAKSHRESSGIEDEWQGDEEFYAGFDDANRNEFISTTSKSLAGKEETKVKRRGSTVFPNITQPYVDAAAARVGDMLLPTDDRNFALEPTPIPEMGNWEPEQQAQPAPQMPGQPPAPPVPMKAIADLIKKEAAKRAEKAQTRIDDWLVECQYHAELRKVIDDAARLGSGVLKGPVPVRRKAQKWQDGQLIAIDEIKPASFRIDPWNLFPAPDCGETIHNGSYVFEEDNITSKKLKSLRGLPGYIDSQIDLVIEEGPKQGSTSTDKRYNAPSSKELFTIYYFYGEIKAEEFQAAGGEIEEDVESYPVKLTMVNDKVICASLNPLDNGEFPYDVIPWKLRPGMPWGMGVSRQMRTAQRIVTAATRNLMDNAGLASGPQIIIRRGMDPFDGRMEITPMKLWVESEDSDGQNSRPFDAVIIPMLQQELQAIIQFGMKLAEDTTGMPQLMQGNQGTAPDTVGGMQILNNNANSVLRRIARLFDSSITEPHIRRYFTWLMEFGDDPEEKGDFQIVARGSSALVERDIQSQEMVQILQMSLNPAFGKSPRRAMDEWLKSRRFSPDNFDYTDEEKQAMAQQQQPEAPQVQVAKIRAQVDMAKTDKELAAEREIAQLENETDQTRIKVDMDRDRALVMSQHEANMAEHQARMQELTVKRELELLKYANERQMTLDSVKAQLAAKAADINLERELAGVSNALDMKKHQDTVANKPPLEPAGRAPDGRSWAQ